MFNLLQKTLFVSLFSVFAVINTQEEPTPKSQLEKLKDSISLLDEEYKNLAKSLPTNSKEAEQKLLALRYEAEKLLLTDSSVFKKKIAAYASGVIALISAYKAYNSPLDCSFNEKDPKEYTSNIKAIEYLIAHLDIFSTKVAITSASLASFLLLDLQKINHQHDRLHQLIKNINITLDTLKN